MGSSQAVYLKAGEQPQYFQFGPPAFGASNLTTTNQSSQPIYKEGLYSTFQAILTGIGVLAATVTLQVSNEDATGRGYILGGGNSPGGPVDTANASPTLTSRGFQFTPNLIGALVIAPNVPAGTTVSAVAANGGSLTMSANATASASAVQGSIFAQNWIATPLATITLNGSTSVSDGFTTTAPWRYVRAVVSGLTGTNAAVAILMGC